MCFFILFLMNGLFWRAMQPWAWDRAACLYSHWNVCSAKSELWFKMSDELCPLSIRNMSVTDLERAYQCRIACKNQIDLYKREAIQLLFWQTFLNLLGCYIKRFISFPLQESNCFRVILICMVIDTIITKLCRKSRISRIHSSYHWNCSIKICISKI